MAKLNRVCIACHKKYSYCSSCAVDAKKPTWMAIFCCENCRNIYNTINDYKYGSLSKEDAFDKLKALDLSSTDELPESFKFALNEILNDGNKAKKVDIVEEDIKADFVPEVIEEKTIQDQIVAFTTETTTEKEVVEEIVGEVIKEEIVKPRPKKRVKSVE